MKRAEYLEILYVELESWDMQLKIVREKVMLKIR